MILTKDRNPWPVAQVLVESVQRVALHVVLDGAIAEHAAARSSRQGSQLLEALDAESTGGVFGSSLEDGSLAFRSSTRRAGHAPGLVGHYLAFVTLSQGGCVVKRSQQQTA